MSRPKKTSVVSIFTEALDAAVGASGVVEIIFGQPYDVTDAVEVVRLALDARDPGEAER